MKKFKFEINGQKFEVEAGPFENNRGIVSVNGTQYHVDLEIEQQQSKTPVILRKTTPSKINTSRQSIPTGKTGVVSHKIIAPLPGSITSLKVEVGDNVKQGDVLLLMEAMKMENSITADKGGSVVKINVSTGDTVLQGDVLIEIA